MAIIVNGREVEGQAKAGGSLMEFLVAIGVKIDRIAIEHNGEIVPRTRWEETRLKSGDRLEIVHFVGGG